MGKFHWLPAKRSLCAGIALLMLFAFAVAPQAKAQCEFGSRTTELVTGTGSFDVSDSLLDNTAVLPLNEWLPIFTFSMRADGQRFLAGLGYLLKDDDGDHPYSLGVSLLPSDILEFTIFREGGLREEWGTLNWQDTIVTGRADRPFPNVPLRFDSEGNLLLAPGNNIDNDPNDLSYDLRLEDFDIHSVPEEGQDYILAFRPSATWRNHISLAYVWFCALMVLPDGNIAVNATGDPSDTYPDDALNPHTAYGSSFAVWDMTSGPTTNNNSLAFKNAWAHPRFMYTPVAEYSRPRFDVGGATFDFVSGEFLELRKIVPLDNWREVIGIDAHGGSTFDFNGPVQFRDTSPINAALKEVNVIFTDIGGDPNGPPGNGGFNPMQGLETFTNAFAFPLGAGHVNNALGRDFAFNGAGVWFDTNNNGFFDPPVPQGGNGGVNLTDHPMVPEGAFDGFGNLPENPDDRNPGVARWEYIPFPPGGGDPWWKIRFRLSNHGRRRVDETPEGYLKATPDPNPSNPSSFQPDYFVVVRTDSGYQDSSALPGDGVGLTYGADFRSFIEPRRFNPNTGHQDGGIFVATQIPADSFIEEGLYVGSAWQDNALWVQDDGTTSEPWWNERTLNQNVAKPVRTTIEIHDLVINYESNNLFSKLTDVQYGGGSFSLGLGFFQSNFDRWMDPFGLRQSQFQDFHSPGVFDWFTFINGSDEHMFFSSFQYPYETVPFFQTDNDLPPFGPRSAFLPSPPAQPELPDYDEWPATLAPDEFPKESQFPLQFRKGRYLKQHIESSSRSTAMIGINLCGADDPIVNQFATVQLQQLTVAFWGPDFDPREDLLALDVNGTSASSGVLLVEDGVPDTASTQIPKPYFGQNGVFGNSFNVVNELAVDTAVPLTALAWRTQPELIDINGDGVGDDMNGDGVVNDEDKAWVLRLRPKAPWRLPARDDAGGFFPVGEETPAEGGKSADAGSNDGVIVSADGTTATKPAQPLDGTDEASKEKTAPVAKNGTGYFAKVPVQINEEDEERKALAGNGEKAFGPAGNPGDDLFVVVRTSNKIKRFEQFRCVVPSTLPERNTNEKPAGVQLLPQTSISVAIYDKSQPEEGVLPYYGPEPFGYDMIEANVSGEVVDLTATGEISQNSGAVPVLGLDLSTNRGAAGIADQGSTGVGSAAAFTVSSAGWTGGAFAGYFLIDANYQQWRIVTNNSKKLTLDAPANASGTPKTGPWIIAKDPTFLEQVIVEFYDNGNDGAFNFLDDLMPMDDDPAVSGVALYRDNDNNSSNKNGIFDEGDIPVKLDYAPFQIGQAGEVQNQAMLVFSTPGTDDIPKSMTNQTRNRQWIPDGFGAGANDPNSGADFFIVIRTSTDITVGDDFRVGMVSWGPNTPTEPDPDTFPPPPASRTGEFDVFSEFPWGQRAIGLITFFHADSYYKQFPEVDNSGFDWVRSSINKATQTAIITAVEGGGGGTGGDLKIISVAPKKLPKQITGGGFTLLITGENFGSNPRVTLDGLVLTVVSSSNTAITAKIPAGSTLDTDGNGKVKLRVSDPATGKFDKYGKFKIVTGGGGGDTAPIITLVSPSLGTRNDFPVTITGQQFKNPTVKFGVVNMPIQGTPTSSQIVVSFPSGGLPTGALDVTVTNGNGLSDVKPGGFTYSNPPGR